MTLGPLISFHAFHIKLFPSIILFLASFAIDSDRGYSVHTLLTATVFFYTLTFTHK